MQKDFDFIITRSDLLADNFYSILFERYQSVKSLFDNTNWEKQKSMLSSTLVLLVKHQNSLEELAPVLQALGLRHQNYGVEEQHYAAVTECLLLALGETYGKYWSHELEHQWHQAISYVCQCMSNSIPKVA